MAVATILSSVKKYCSNCHALWVLRYTTQFVILFAFLLIRSGSSYVLLPALFILHCSRQKSTRCQFKLCSPAAPLRLRSSKRLLMLIHTSFRKASLRFTCVVRRLRKGYRKFTAAPTYIASIALSCFTATTFVGARGAASRHSFQNSNRRGGGEQ